MVADSQAHRAGIPANGKRVPDGAMMGKVHWKPKQSVSFPETTGSGDLQNVDFMVKDSNRFADSGGWGICRVRLERGDRYIHAQALRLAHRRKGTTPSAASHAPQGRRRGTTCLQSTESADGR